MASRHKASHTQNLLIQLLFNNKFDIYTLSIAV